MPSAVFLVIAIVAVGVLALLAIVLKGGHRKSLNKEEYQTRWLKIENSLRKSDPASYPMAIINADKLVDKAMQELGIAGQSMGERLKRMDGRFSDINAVWRAHKVRNQIAHEDGYGVDYTTTSRAMASYKRALKDLGAI